MAPGITRPETIDRIILFHTGKVKLSMSPDMDENLWRETPSNHNSFDNTQHLNISTPEYDDGRLFSQSEVLLNPDLIELILSFMRSSEDAMEKPDCTHLLWASLTCKAFFDPGINVLWKSMDSWSAILHLIPTLEKDDLDNKIFRTTEVLRLDHLHRLREYSRRISHFSFVPWTQPISPQIYTSLAQLPHFELFPRLSKLDILLLDEINLANTPSLSLILPPTLSDLAICHITRPVEILAATLLHNISEKCQGFFRKLSLEGKISILCFNAIRILHNLETLHLFIKESILPPNFVGIISELESLRWLHISLEDCCTWKLLAGTSTVGFPHGFVSLRKLNITGSSISILALLRHVTPLPKLASISLHFYSDSNNKADQCFRCLVPLTGPDLQAIEITSRDTAPLIRRVAVTHLLDLSSTKLQILELQVKTLTLSTIHALSTSKFSDTLQKISIVAKNHRRYSLSDPMPPPFEGVDLTSVWSFSNLKSLKISMALDLSTERIESIKEIIQRPNQCHGLQELILEPHWSIYKPTYPDFNYASAFIFARFINHLFPHLKKLDLSKFGEVDASWREGVEVMMIGLRNFGKRKGDCQACPASANGINIHRR